MLSQDGRNWARIEGEHHSGALFDAGDGGEWDAAFVGAPMVRKTGVSSLKFCESHDDSVSADMSLKTATCGLVLPSSATHRRWYAG